MLDSFKILILRLIIQSLTSTIEMVTQAKDKRIPSEKTCLKKIMTFANFLVNFHHMGLVFSYTGKRKQGFYGSEGATKKFEDLFMSDKSWQEVMNEDIREGSNLLFIIFKSNFPSLIFTSAY